MTLPLGWKQPQRKHIQLSPGTRWYDLLLWCPSEEAPLYMVGDKVWLNGQNITMIFPMKKLDHKWLCPYPETSHIMKHIPTKNYHHHSAKPTLYSSVTRCNTTMWTHCRASSTQPSTPSHSCWSQRIWSGTYPRQLGLPRETQIPHGRRIWYRRRQMETMKIC